MSIEVNGHQLPPLLVKLIEDGKWVNGQIFPMDALNKMVKNAGLPPISLAMAMYNIKTFEHVTRQNISYYANMKDPAERKSMFELYYLASSKESGKDIEDEGLLDIDKSVFITDNYDENAIYFDYRKNPDNPSIVAFVSGGKLIAPWRMIAPDFETFARELGLVE